MGDNVQPIYYPSCDTSTRAIQVVFRYNVNHPKRSSIGLTSGIADWVADDPIGLRANPSVLTYKLTFTLTEEEQSCAHFKLPYATDNTLQSATLNGHALDVGPSLALYPWSAGALTVTDSSRFTTSNELIITVTGGLEYTLIKAHAMCKSDHTLLKTSHDKTSPLECAAACYDDAACNFFIYGSYDVLPSDGTGSRYGKCLTEHTVGAHCPEGYDTGSIGILYDFYAIGGVYVEGSVSLECLACPEAIDGVECSCPSPWANVQRQPRTCDDYAKAGVSVDGLRPLVGSAHGMTMADRLGLPAAAGYW